MLYIHTAKYVTQFAFRWCREFINHERSPRPFGRWQRLIALCDWRFIREHSHTHTLYIYYSLVLMTIIDYSLVWFLFETFAIAKIARPIGSSRKPTTMAIIIIGSLRWFCCCCCWNTARTAKSGFGQQKPRPRLGSKNAYVPHHHISQQPQ